MCIAKDGGFAMQECIELTKIWEDVDFFEINMQTRSPSCDTVINFYTTNEELEELRKGITTLKSDSDFVWTSGEDTGNVTHYVFLRFFFCSKRGHVAIEVIIDNKLDSPYRLRANFYIITELGSLDEFANQLNKFIKGITHSVNGVIYSHM
jgi:hypothetical protein